MSIKLSHNQLDDINSYLDQELQSCNNSQSDFHGSIAASKRSGISFSGDRGNTDYNLPRNFQPMLGSSDEIIALQNKLGELEKRVMGISNPQHQDKKQAEMLNFLGQNKPRKRSKKKKLSNVVLKMQKIQDVVKRLSNQVENKSQNNTKSNSRNSSFAKNTKRSNRKSSKEPTRARSFYGVTQKIINVQKSTKLDDVKSKLAEEKRKSRQVRRENIEL